MRTLVVSDLHLGGRTGVDVLRDRPAARAAAARAGSRRADRLVLLGDTLELRHGPVREALAAARARAARSSARRSTAATEVVLVPGNHDHALATPWLDAPPRPLGSETRVRPATASPVARRGRRLARARAARRSTRRLSRRVAARRRLRHPRPLPRPARHRPDVRAPRRGRDAAHGRRRCPAPATAEDYERVLAPLYAWIARRRPARAGGAHRRGRRPARARPTRCCTGDGHRPVRTRALAADRSRSASAA